MLSLVQEGHGNSAITELGGHFVMNAITLSQARVMT